MGFRFRRSIKLLPGVRWNISKTGTSWSFGVTASLSTRVRDACAALISLPGTGLSFSSTSGRRKTGTRPRAVAPPAAQPRSVATPAPIPTVARFGIHPQPAPKGIGTRKWTMHVAGLIMCAATPTWQPFGSGFGLLVFLLGFTQPSRHGFARLELERVRTAVATERKRRLEQLQKQVWPLSTQPHRMPPPSGRSRDAVRAGID